MEFGTKHYKEKGIFIPLLSSERQHIHAIFDFCTLWYNINSRLSVVTAAKIVNRTSVETDELWFQVRVLYLVKELLLVAQAGVVRVKHTLQVLNVHKGINTLKSANKMSVNACNFIVRFHITLSLKCHTRFSKGKSNLR